MMKTIRFVVCVPLSICCWEKQETNKPIKMSNEIRPCQHLGRN